MRWLKPLELTEPGTYVLGRTDDDPGSLIAITLTPGCSATYPYGVQHVQTWDEECRFFGPLPEISK